MKKLFLAWQEPQSRHWFPIGQLAFDGKKYYFAYIQGVKKAQAESNFRLLHSFPERDRIYTSSDIWKILRQNPESICVCVERVNPLPTPIQFRLLCNMTVQWDDDFIPFSSQDYQPIVDPSLLLSSN